MSAIVLGISAFYHDSAAALVRDGEIVAAAQEERFSRVKHDPRFPRNAIDYCLEEAFIEPTAIDAVVFYDSPPMKLDRVLRNSLHAGIAGGYLFERAARSILAGKIFLEDHVSNALGTVGRAGRVLFTEHHFAHAASAFFPSPFKNAAIISLDGVGEWTTTAIGRGDGTEIELLEELYYPHSLGLLYSAFTRFCGFEVNSGEYKLMGLAAYGLPRFAAAIRNELIDLRADGSYRLNLDHFSFQIDEAMVSERFEKLFAGPERIPGGPITRREADLAASIQKVTTEVLFAVARHARAITATPNVTLAGGVALNCVAIGELVRSNIFENVWVQPAAGDAGGALGAALLVSHTRFDAPRPLGSSRSDLQRGSYLGPGFSPKEVSAYLDRHGYPYKLVGDPDERARLVANAIAEGNIVGVLSGRMEFGPRALGGRSILGDPRRSNLQSVINEKIKHRESFRPFAPAVLIQDVRTYFDLETESPYMLMTAPVRSERRIRSDASWFQGHSEEILRSTCHSCSDIPAVTHVDYSARVQTISEERNPEFYRMVRAFKDRTGIGLVINTSFNHSDEPIVCSPKDAYRCFMRTGIDLLVLEDAVLWRADQPAFEDVHGWPPTEACEGEGKPAEPDIGTFYQRIALPLAARLRALGRELLAAGPDLSVETYWIARPPSRRRLVDFEQLGARSPEELETLLRRLWTENGLGELCDLAPGLAQLAAILHRTDRQKGVSDLVYVMF